MAAARPSTRAVNDPHPGPGRNIGTHLSSIDQDASNFIPSVAVHNTLSLAFTQVTAASPELKAD